MKLAGLVLAGLRHHARTHAGVVLGTAIGSAVLVGALSVGDSVRHSLRRQATQRIGAVDVVVAPGDRFFRAELASELASEERRAAPVVQLAGVASTADAAHRANGVQVLGVDARFHELALEPWAGPLPGPDQVLLNERLAAQLAVAPGDEIILRVEKPSALPRDMALARQEDYLVALRVEVLGVLGEASFGRFSLAADQVPPFGAYLSIEWLQERLELGARANLLLVDDLVDDDGALAATQAALQAAWTLEDGELAIGPLEEPDVLEVTSSRVFLDTPLFEAARDLPFASLGVLTYFVNELRVRERATPYSMVSAIGPLGSEGDRASLAGSIGSDWRSIAAQDLGAEGIVINTWLASDLEAEVGDALTLTYFVIGEAGRLREESREFRVRGVVEIEGLAADPLLMPDFPGLADSESCREWDPGFPLDLDLIRDKDEVWWDEHAGTPKAFVSLEAGRAMWASRFGSLTGLRVPDAAGSRDDLAAALRANLAPASLGIFARDLRGPALVAGTSATDFGGLFLGLSFFLIVSALLLTAMLFAFGVEQRAREIGTLLAVGFRARDVRRLFLAEAALLAALGVVLGVLLGLGYTRLVLAGLVTIWSDAVASATIAFHAEPATVALGALLSFAAALAAIVLAFRAPFRLPATTLLGGSIAARDPGAPPPARASVAVAAVCVLACGALIVLGSSADASAAAGTFFGAGGLLLVAGIAASRAILVRIARATGAGDGPRSVAGLGLRNAMRRPGRSLATIVLLASGSFLVLAIGANRLGPPEDPSERASGTGGFTLFGRSSLALTHDLETAEGREFYGLDEQDLADVNVVPLRVRAGDEASCLNLSLPQNPRLVGVDPAALAERGSFNFASGGAATSGESPWELLDGIDAEGAIPAIGDAASVKWVMKKGVGDTLDYLDERGEPMRVRIVGTVSQSILQGNLLISARRFEERFPSESGYRMLLIDAPPERVQDLAATLARALSDVGLELTSTAERLAAFNAIQNTYLLIFQLLGFLGLLLGSAGLGMVVLRNTLERRSELALLRAVGFRARATRWLVLSEHGLLLALGLAAGALAALVALGGAAVAPAPGPLFVILVSVAASGLVWLVLATALALRGPLLEALRAE